MSIKEDLENDLKSLDEAYSKKDVIKDLMIIAGIGGEIAALIAVVIATLNVITIATGGLAYLGIPVAAGTVQLVARRALPEILKQYSSLNRSDRKAVRIALKFLGISPNIFA